MNPEKKSDRNPLEQLKFCLTEFLASKSGLLGVSFTRDEAKAVLELLSVPRVGPTHLEHARVKHGRDALMEENVRLRREVVALEKERDDLRAGKLVTGTFCEQLWNGLQKLGPWTESNDMDWEDEILCGLQIAVQRFKELEDDNMRLHKAADDAMAVLYPEGGEPMPHGSLVEVCRKRMKHPVASTREAELKEEIEWLIANNVAAAKILVPGVEPEGLLVDLCQRFKDEFDAMRREKEALGEERRLEWIRAEMAEAKLEGALKAWDHTTRLLDWLERHCCTARNAERYLPVEIHWGKSRGGRTLRATIERELESREKFKTMSMGYGLPEQ